jgi:hypothetical protein
MTAQRLGLKKAFCALVSRKRFVFRAPHDQRRPGAFGELVLQHQAGAAVG